jgi:hypothetical protein
MPQFINCLWNMMCSLILLLVRVEEHKEYIYIYIYIHLGLILDVKGLKYVT